MLGKLGVKVYTYTARRDLDFSNVKHLVVNGSGFMVHNNFTVVKEFSGKKRKMCRQL